MNRKRRVCSRPGDYSKPYWHEILQEHLPSLPTAIHGEILEFVLFHVGPHDVVDVFDSSNCWYSAVVLGIRPNPIAPTSLFDVRVHFLAWSSGYDETILLDHRRFAPLGTYTQSITCATHHCWTEMHNRMHRDFETSRLTDYYEMSVEEAQQIWHNLCSGTKVGVDMTCADTT